MKNYIFLTTEGYTFQPNSEAIEPDIENLQVIGFAEGEDSKQVFDDLVKENDYLKETNFNEIFSYELDEDFRGKKEYHYLNR